MPEFTRPSCSCRAEVIQLLSAKADEYVKFRLELGPRRMLPEDVLREVIHLLEEK
jgi:hypothetical protein